MRIWNLPVVDFISFDELEEERPVALVTTAGAWEAVADDLAHLNVIWRSNITDATIQQWANFTVDLQQLTINNSQLTIYAVGGGQVINAAKYIAYHTGLELVSLPTALTADAFLTWNSGVRAEGCVRYLETKPPERLIMDVDVLAAAPDGIRAAGICDVLSIATSLWDWELAAEKGENPEGMELIPWVADAAQSILDGALECAESAGAGDAEGLKQLLDCLALGVQLCNQVGHSRPKEGSEHHFSYSVENYLSNGLSHANLVGPGIIMMAQFQDQDTDYLERALKACHIPLDNIPEDVVGMTLKGLPEYVRKHDLPYGIAHELNIA
ncbi:MAG: iron-containing alcohol dehydrogenase [Anaerolineales bacterium]|nr:iron-containing alcohol dehydrogenase [Chloroflexota bacterium]MBL7163754.1 iron-containing alcohol dehydrogenase [Anaerolineales bacterium]